jgi:hypothetical protein
MVAKRGRGREGELLFPERAGVHFADFVLHYCHIGVGDFGHRGEEEDYLCFG